MTQRKQNVMCQTCYRPIKSGEPVLKTWDNSPMCATCYALTPPVIPERCPHPHYAHAICQECMQARLGTAESLVRELVSMLQFAKARLLYFGTTTSEIDLVLSRVPKELQKP